MRCFKVLKQPPFLGVECAQVSPHVVMIPALGIGPQPYELIQCYQLLQVLFPSCHTWKPWVAGRGNDRICGNSQNHSLDFSEKVAACASNKENPKE